MSEFGHEGVGLHLHRREDGLARVVQGDEVRPVVEVATVVLLECRRQPGELGAEDGVQFGEATCGVDAVVESHLVDERGVCGETRGFCLEQRSDLALLAGAHSRPHGVQHLVRCRHDLHSVESRIRDLEEVDGSAQRYIAAEGDPLLGHLVA